MRDLAWPFAVAVLLAALLVLPAIAQAVLSGPNGRILFVSGRDGGQAGTKIYLRTIVGSAGGGTAGEPIAASTGQHRHPTWSPDRTKIAYARGDENCAPIKCDIFVLDITTPGAAPQNITNSATVNEDRPAWSPDGTRIAYESEVTAASGQTDLIVHTVAGGATVNLTNTATAGQFEGKPAWTPDSATIFFHLGNPMAAGAMDIFRVPAGGGTPANVTFGPGTSEFQPSISPDGTQMCFTRGDFSDPNATQIVVSLVNGGGQTPLVGNDLAAADYNCTWSPDGTKIAWVQGQFTTGDLVMANSDNSGGFISLEATVGAFDGNPDWAPDGQPVCDPITVSTLFNAPVSVPLVCNDTGPTYERTGITENIAEPPTNGTLGAIQQGAPTTEPSSVIYTPNLGFSGADTFQFNGFGGGGFATRVPATINVDQGPPPDGDTTAPELTLSGKTTQSLGSAVKVSAICDEACAVTATGKLKVKTKGEAVPGSRATQSFNLRQASAQLVANQNGQLKLKVPKSVQRAGTQALAAGGKVKATLTVTAADAAGNQASATRTVKLKLKKG